MNPRLSSEVGVAESGVAESGGRDANGAAEAQRAADLIATLGAQNKAQREQIAALKSAITTLQQEFKAAEQVHEAAKASKNAELLDFMKAHAREQQTKQTVAQLRQANAAKWEQVKEEQAKLAVLGLQSAKLALEEAQAAERRRAHAATVEVVRQRAELAEAVLAQEVSAAAARLAEHDRRAAEAQQAEAAERARVAEAAEAAKAAEAAEAAKAAEAARAAKAAEQAEAAERARRAEAPVIELLRGGALLFDTIQASVGGSPEALAAVLDTLQARRPMAALRYLVAHCAAATMPVYHMCCFRPTSSCTATPTATSSCSSTRERRPATATSHTGHLLTLHGTSHCGARSPSVNGHAAPCSEIESFRSPRPANVFGLFVCILVWTELCVCVWRD